jgi:2-polyprenyl-3-methyl-5-hydroxy-6-metoxy-1,4-benzoquinol methylase
MALTDTGPGYSARYDPDEHFDHWYTDATARQLVEYLTPGDEVLEFGSATGRMTDAMCRAGAVVLGVEQSGQYIDRARARSSVRACYVRDDFERWVGVSRESLARRFDHVVATNVVHEVHDLSGLLDGCAGLLTRDALLHISLQNPQSIHRLVGRALGQIQDLREVAPEGQDLLTLRIYGVEELVSLIVAAGFEIVARHGVMLKPFPNAQMEKLSVDQLEGLVAAGPSLPDNCAMNYLVARHRDG